MSATTLNNRQVSGLQKVGDAFMPGNREFPRFSKLNLPAQMHRVIDYLPAQDASDLKLLLGIFGLLPGWFVTFIIRALERSWISNCPMGSIFRQIRLGLRGLVFALYYSHPQVEQGIGYSVSVYTDDLQKKQ